MTRKQIWSVIRKLDYTLDDNTMETMTDDIYNKILTNTYDFSRYNCEIFTQQNKKRMILSILVYTFFSRMLMTYNKFRKLIS